MLLFVGKAKPEVRFWKRVKSLQPDWWWSEAKLPEVDLGWMSGRQRQLLCSADALFLHHTACQCRGDQRVGEI